MQFCCPGLVFSEEPKPGEGKVREAFSNIILEDDF